MPAPIALSPLAWKLAQWGAVAALGYYAARRHREARPRDLWRETVLNDIDEGLETEATRTPDEARLAAAGKFRRGFRLGTDGPGLELEFASLSRLRFRRI